MELDEQVECIQNGNEEVFEALFFKYYKSLCNFADTFVSSRELAKDTVQEVFMKIWNNRAQWKVNYSMQVYLYQAVRNQALNNLEKKKVKRKYTQKYHQEKQHKVGAKNNPALENKIVESIWKIVKELPPRRKMVFELHRKHGLSYKEISEVMDITPKTVENHMGRALDDIRNALEIE